MDRNKIGEEKFWESIAMHRVPGDWADELYDYIILGYTPGSFHKALYSNNLMKAAIHSHPLNTWPSIISVMKWLINYAPHQSYGSDEKIEEWLKLTKKQRREILEQKELVLIEQDTVWKILSENAR